MVRSMTGFGKAEGKIKNGTMHIEIKSFNHRFFEFSGKFPGELVSYEEEIKKSIKKKIRRGSINVAFLYTKGPSGEKCVKIDSKIAKRYFNLSRELKRKLSLKDNLGIKDMLSFPGVIVYEEAKEDLDKNWGAVRVILGKALRNLVAAKVREGKDLSRDLAKHVFAAGRAADKIEIRAKKVIQGYGRNFKDRFKKLLGKNIEQERLRDEIALFARGADISEELSRAKSHIENMRRLLSLGGDIGRQFDFVAQELYRETNTIGAKGNDYEISKEVVILKSEIEKIREQVQNIE
ncbi:MAG: YicC family protein [Candidatus Omnitrophica bacterium]|nr:YicC family protein [Candidatus Omnitrophota bacterium]